MSNAIAIHPQIFLVEFGSIVFSCHPLHISEWMWCMFFGVGSLVWQQIIAFIPLSIIPKKFTIGRQPTEEIPSIADAPEEMTDRADSRAELKRAQILWMRGLNRLQQQVGHLYLGRRCRNLVLKIIHCYAKYYYDNYYTKSCFNICLSL